MYHKGAFESITGLCVNCVSKIVNAYLDSPSIRITIPNNVVGMSCYRSSQRLFTTKNSQERIQLAQEDRKAKREIRNLRREGNAARIDLCLEAEKVEGVVS